MTEPAEKRLNVEQFLAFAEGREGAWELHDGRAIAMSPERVRHTGVKTEAAFALRQAIAHAKAPCRAFAEGVTIRVREDRAFVPDAVVVCPPPPPDVVVIDNPQIVVEVLSPATAAIDHGPKLDGYFSLASLAHYLVLDPDRGVCIHHARGRGDVIETRILHDGVLRLDPPGIELSIAELFAADV